MGIFAAESGAGARTVVLLHGFGGTHRTWDAIAADLAADNHVLAYDLPGHGGSLDVADAGPAKIAVRAILGDLAERGLSHVHLAGHSMGGAIAAMMALADPDRVASLTLLAPGGFGDEINGRLLARYAAAREAGEIRAALENMYGWNNPVPDHAVETLVAARRVPGQAEKLVEISQGLARDGKQGVIPRDRLAGLTMPVKVLWGTQDRVLPTRQAHRLPPLFAAHVFEDTGHMLPDECTGDVIRLIRQNIR